MHCTIRNVVIVISFLIALVAVGSVGDAIADPPNCATLQQRINAHDNEAAQYNSEVAALNAAGSGAAWQVSKYNAWKARLQGQAVALDAEKQQCEPKSDSTAAVTVRLARRGGLLERQQVHHSR